MLAGISGACATATFMAYSLLGKAFPDLRCLALKGPSLDENGFAALRRRIDRKITGAGKNRRWVRGNQPQTPVGAGDGIRVNTREECMGISRKMIGLAAD